MLSTILQIVVFQFCFMIVYEVLLRKETFFNWNRGYLLGTSVLSILLPFIKLKSFSNVVPSEFIEKLPTVFLGEQISEPTLNTEPINVVISENTTSFSFSHIWILGVIIFSCLLFYKLLKIWKYKQSCNSIKKNGYSIITLIDSEDAFSFLKMIFLGDQLESNQKESILKHECVHVKENHTLDLLWFELLRIVFWFNPLIYLYQKRITEVHEFIADKKASKDQQNYYESLLAKAFNISKFSMVNQFYSSSLIKKRIIMLTKEKSNKRKLIKYITIIPVVLVMLFYVSCSVTEIQNTTETARSSETTVLEDVITIINKTATNDDNYKDVSEKQFNTIINDLKQYKNTHSTKIEQTDFNKYSTIWFAQIENVPSEDFKKYMNQYKDLYNFYLSYMFIEKALNETDTVTFDTSEKLFIKLLSDNKMVNRLQELNYVLPNEEKYRKAKVENELKKESLNDAAELDIPFAILEKSPIFPGCDENTTLEEIKNCLSLSIAKHVNTNFDINIAKTHNLTGRQRISTMFKIDKNGMITNIKVRAPHPDLVTETKRVLNLLPKMKPGIHKGKTVTVPYSLPIIFQVQ